MERAAARNRAGAGGVAAFLVTLGATIALASLATDPAARAAPGATAQERPNIVVVMTDDQTVESMRVLPRVRELLVERGVSFTNSFASNPVCCPSRATYLTGQYSHNNGVLRNDSVNGGYGALPESRTFPIALQRSGYFTAHIGKYLNGYGKSDPTRIPPGWTAWYGGVDPSTYRMFGYTLNRNGTLVTRGDFTTPDPRHYQTDVYTDMAADLIERRAALSKPFFLSVAPLAPHAETFKPTPGTDDPPLPEHPNPRPAPRHAGAFATEPLPRGPSFNEADISDKPAGFRERWGPLRPETIADQVESYRSRLTSLLAIDDMVAEIVTTLRDAGELDRTVIVFTSDNGYMLGEHRVRAGKQFPYEESIRVPLVVRGPGVPAGEVRTAPAVNVDLAPTILDYADAAPVAKMDGRSLRRIMEQPSFQPGRAVVLENWCQINEPCFDPEVPRYQGVRTERYSYMEYPSGERELYDLEIDPFQLESAHDDPAYADERAALADLLDELRDCRGSICRQDPELRLAVEYRSRRPSGGRCAASAVRARVGGRDAHDIVTVLFRAVGRRTVDRRRPLRDALPRRRLRPSRPTTFTAAATMLDGRVETLRGVVPPSC